MNSVYILRKDRLREHDVDRLLQAVQELSRDKKYRAVLEEIKSEYSDLQRAYYWGCVVEAISQETGYETKELHEYLCGTRWGWKDKKVPKTPRNPEGIESVPVRTTTRDEHGRRSKLGKMQFEEFIEFARRFAAQKLNLVIPDPDKEWRLHKEAA